MKLQIETPSTFAELLETVEKFQSSSSISWYRGCRNKAHGLKPSLFRHKTKSNIEDIISLESEITTRFVQRSLPFLQRSLTDDWDKLFLMQHYGVPTRLLDWSENPFVSIYFALVTASEPKTTDACLWMCDPIAWNRAALAHISYKGGVLDQSNTLMAAYAPGKPAGIIPVTPVMIYGSYNSPRIVAQRGGFALFGQSMNAMEDTFETDQFPAGVLKKVVIPHAKVGEIRSSLFRKGFTESVVFPDLEGLARELSRIFEF